MESARDYAGALVRSLVSMGTSVGSVTRQTLFPPLTPAARPFRVSNHDRSSRKGVVASSLQELISKALDALLITAGLITLVLEEDGTVVDTEEFFQSLGDNTHFILLEKGQKWTQGENYILTVQQTKKMGVANITLDLYKLNPKDFIGCLNIRATFYEIYSVSYDIKCMGAKTVLRPNSATCKQLSSHSVGVAYVVAAESGPGVTFVAKQWLEVDGMRMLRFVSHVAQITGQFLLYTGSYVLQLMGEYEEDGMCTNSKH